MSTAKPFFYPSNICPVLFIQEIGPSTVLWFFFPHSGDLAGALCATEARLCRLSMIWQSSASTTSRGEHSSFSFVLLHFIGSAASRAFCSLSKLNEIGLCAFCCWARLSGPLSLPASINVKSKCEIRLCFIFLILRMRRPQFLLQLGGCTGEYSDRSNFNRLYQTVLPSQSHL